MGKAGIDAVRGGHATTGSGSAEAAFAAAGGSGRRAGDGGVGGGAAFRAGLLVAALALNFFEAVAAVWADIFEDGHGVLLC